MNKEKMNLFVITGGPGVGKTTLINKLKEVGYPTVEEEARKIIKQQMAIGGNGLPWKDKVLYAQLMLEASIKTFQKVSRGKRALPIFFDRGILDTVCYINMEGIALTSEALMALNKVTYNRNVFMLPPWKEIYRTDDERKQSYPEAVSTFYKMKKTYLTHGYNVIEVPKTSVSERVHFIKDRMNDLL